MTTKLDELDEFDPAEYLDTPEAIQAYIDEAAQTGDAAFITESLGVVARAKGMTELAETTGLSRESLYRSLSNKGNPSLKSLLPILNALNLSITIGASTKKQVAKAI